MPNIEYELNEKIHAIIINPYLSWEDFCANCDLIKKYNIKNISTSLNYLDDFKNRLSNYSANINALISYPLADLPISFIEELVNFAKDKGANGIEYIPNFINLSKKNFSYLSDGEKQISLIARALIKKPEILILDEPIANLDYKSRFFVVDKINELSKINSKILCVTHDISTITQIYDRVIMLKNGKIIADGDQNKVINSKNLNKLYGIQVQVTNNNGLWNINRLSK